MAYPAGRVLPDNKSVDQGGSHRPGHAVEVSQPEWVERSHLSPIADPTAWEAMTGISTVAVLYRGVFVQEFQVKGAWGIDGSIDVDPKHFKPRLNREAFVLGQFQDDVEAFLRQCHPAILEAMVRPLSEAVARGALDKWTEKRWASLWLSVPRGAPYAAAVSAWDAVFRAIPAFELAAGNKWQAIPLDQVTAFVEEVFVAPLAEEQTNDVVRAALHFLRNTGRPVIRGIRKDNSWLKFAPAAYGTTVRTRVELEEKEGAYPIGGNRFASPSGDWVPLYEGKMVQAFDHRAASVVVNPENQHRPAQPVPATPAQPRCQVHRCEKEEVLYQAFDKTRAVVIR